MQNLKLFVSNTFHSTSTLSTLKYINNEACAKETLYMHGTYKKNYPQRYYKEAIRSAQSCKSLRYL